MYKFQSIFCLFNSESCTAVAVRYDSLTQMSSNVDRDMLFFNLRTPQTDYPEVNVIAFTFPAFTTPYYLKVLKMVNWNVTPKALVLFAVRSSSQATLGKITG